MHTSRQIERLWGQGRYTQLFDELTRGRTESDFAGFLQAANLAGATAAMATIRMDELSLAKSRFSEQLLRAILGSQESDGGWGEPMLTALCLRALLANNGSGIAIDRGLQYLANLQQDTGIWPRLPFRRLPGDALTSAFVLSQLGIEPRFQDAVAFNAALDWFSTHASTLDVQTTRLWNRKSMRMKHVRRPAIDHESRLAMLWT